MDLPVRIRRDNEKNHEKHLSQSKLFFFQTHSSKSFDVHSHLIVKDLNDESIVGDS